MKRIILSLSLSALLVILLLVSLTSCQVNWFGEKLDVEWWAVAVPVAVLAAIVLIIGKLTLSNKTYQCPECKKSFQPKWYQSFFAVHINSDRVFKCPHCGKRGFCKVYKE